MKLALEELVEGNVVVCTELNSCQTILQSGDYHCGTSTSKSLTKNCHLVTLIKLDPNSNNVLFLLTT